MEFVTFELAKKLKEKGFPQHITNEAYITDNYGENEIEIQLGYDIGDRLPISLIPDYMDDVASPTISQVLKWLREEKKIHLVIDIEPNGYFFIVNYNITTDFNDKYQFDIYNSLSCYYDDKQAALAGIEYCLDNLI